ncbi:MAG: heavy-metal-associated domain-containing protein, partial [Clostridiales bacterium]|nr:heavy-metal-associated domain-containing protein [Clostridiales bacterium]
MDLAEKAVTNKTIEITGMTCASCAMRIEKVVGKLDGVTQAAVNTATEKLTVAYDESKVSEATIQEAIEKIGFGVVAELPQTTSVVIPIAGMTCAACSARIEKMIAKMDGVTAATVNLATEKATVEYDRKKVKLSAIKQTIEKLGYKA